MAADEPPIEDPYRRSRRITQVRPTRRIGQSLIRPVAVPATGGDAGSTGTASASTAATHPELPATEFPVASPTAVKPTPVETAPVAATVSLPIIDTIAPEPVPPPSRASRRTPRPPAPPPPGHSTYSSAIIIVVLSASLLGYAFNIASIQAAADKALAGVSASGQPGHGNTLSNIVTGLTLVPVAVLFFAIMKTLAAAIGLAEKKQEKAKEPSSRKLRKRPLEEFKKSVAHYGIDSRTAYQAYLLLKPCFEENETPRHSLALEADMGLTPAQIRELHLALLRNIEREAGPETRLPAVTTILDLLTVAQRAPRQHHGPLVPVYEPGDPGQKKKGL